MWETVYVFNNTGRLDLPIVIDLIFIAEVLVILCALLNGKTEKKRDFIISKIALIAVAILLCVNVLKIANNYHKKDNESYIESIALEATNVFEGEMYYDRDYDTLFRPVIIVDGESIDIEPMLGQNIQLEDGDIVKVYVRIANINLDQEVYDVLRVDVKRS